MFSLSSPKSKGRYSLSSSCGQLASEAYHSTLSKDFCLNSLESVHCFNGKVVQKYQQLFLKEFVSFLLLEQTLSESLTDSVYLLEITFLVHQFLYVNKISSVLIHYKKKKEKNT